MTGDRTSTERIVLDVLGALLQRDDIGVHERFFDLGADSLLIVQARDRLSSALGRDLTAVDLFTYPNVAALVAHLTDGSDVSAAAEGVRRAEHRRAQLAARRERART